MFHTIENALSDLKAGRVIIVVDDENRENEGDLVALAEHATPEIINFMAAEGRGLICTSITEDRAVQMKLPFMTDRNTDELGTAFTVSIDHCSAKTGISAFERSRTIQELISDESKPDDFSRPGHIFPLVAKKGGVLKRAGHTEASVDLAMLCGAKPAGVICEIMNEDGTMARVPELIAKAEALNIKIITIEDLKNYRLCHEKLVAREAEVRMPSRFGLFTMMGYSNEVDGLEHVALIKGRPEKEMPFLVRVHSECMTGDVFGSRRCDCGPQLQSAMRMIEQEGSGAIIYMRQEGRGIGLLNKLKAYKLQERGYDTVQANELLGFPPELREYGVASQIIKDLGIQKVRLMTNNPHKLKELSKYGVEITERVPLYTDSESENETYMRTKIEKMGHLIG